MEMESAQVQIGSLEGKSNWLTWKYKLCVLLRGIPGALDVLEGKMKMPKALEESATTEQKKKYQEDLDTFSKADSNALLIITTNMTEDTLQKVIRFTTAYDVWQELHRLYDENVEDKTYDLCIEFFRYRKNPEDDVVTHTSKLKNLWNSLQNEFRKDKLSNCNDCQCDLPELLLICKILGTLPERYFSFKSSWMLLPKCERTIDNFANQLCAYEKALHSEKIQEVQVPEEKKKRTGKLNCFYCKKAGHVVIQCKKWKADGKPKAKTKKKKVSVKSNVKKAPKDTSKNFHSFTGASGIQYERVYK